MSASKNTTQTERTGGQSTASFTEASKMCTLASLAELFSARELSPPLSSVALQPAAIHRQSSIEETLTAEEEDYIVRTLRSAPLSLFCESANISGSSNSGNYGFLPPLLEKQRNADLREHAASQKTTKSMLAGESSTPTFGAAFSSATSSSLSSSSHEGLTVVLKVLSMLSLLLQRSPAALEKSGKYSKLLHLLIEHDFAGHACEDMEKLWQLCADGADVDLITALALYCDVLLLFVFHCDTARNDVEMSSGSFKKPDDTALPTGSSAPACASPAILTRLYALNQEMGSSLTNAGTLQSSRPALLRRSVVSLTAFLIHHAAQLPQEVAESAMRDLETGGLCVGANMAHMAFVAAVPHMCQTMSAEWQCRTLEVLRQATMYDADVHVAYCTDGGRSVVLVVQNLAMHEFGSAVCNFLSIMSDAAWSYCTADALVHICHAVGIYGATWSTYPASYVGLINFLHRALQRYHEAYVKHRISHLGNSNCNEDALMLGILEDQQCSGAGRTASWLFEQSMESLKSGTVLAVEQQQESNSSSKAPNSQAVQSEKALMTKVPNDAEDGGSSTDNEREEPMAYLLKCEAEVNTPRSFIFYLSLLAYVTSALPPLLNSFDELPLFFALPGSAAATTQSSTASAITEGGAEEHVRATTNSAPARADLRLFSLCVDFLRANLSVVVRGGGCANSERTSNAERQRRLLCESCVCLLSAFMCAFPHSIQQLEQQTGTHHLVHTVSFVVTTIFSEAPSASFQMRWAAYSLLYRYSSAVGSLRAIVADLMSPANWTSLNGSNDDDNNAAVEYIQANFVEAVELYTHLCTFHEESDVAEVSRVLVTLAELPAGAFRCTPGGTAVAARVVNAIFDFCEVVVDESALFAGVTVAQLPRLFSRLTEALDTLVHGHSSGCWMAGGSSTWQSAQFAVWLLYKTTLLYRAPAVLGAATFPVPAAPVAATTLTTWTAEAPGRRTRSVLEVCLTVLCDADYQPAHREVAELLVAFLRAAAEQEQQQQQNAPTSFQALRYTLSTVGVAQLREALLEAQKGNCVGSVSNALRLEVWLAMVRWCPALFVFLFGPQTQGDDESDNEAEEDKKRGRPKGKGRDFSNGEGASENETTAAASAKPENLPFAKLLASTIRNKEASLHEKALALQVLRHAGLHSVVEVREIAALLKESGVEKSESEVVESSDTNRAAATTAAASTTPSTNKSTDEWEAATLAAACIAYVNTFFAAQLVMSKTEGADNSIHCNNNRNSERSGPFITTADVHTPLQRLNPAPLTPPGAASASSVMASRCKVLSKYTDKIDQLLRHAQSIMDRCRSAYERDSREVRYEDVFEWMQRCSKISEDSVSGFGDGVSASVVLPWRYGTMSRSGAHRLNNRSISGKIGSARRMLGFGGSFVRHATPTALASAFSRVGIANVSTAPLSPLVSLTSGQQGSLLPYLRLTPVGPAATRFFCGTGDDGCLNALATLLDTSADLATAVEQLLWFSGTDTNAAGLFSTRTQGLLASALCAVVACRPHSPLLTRLLTRQAQCALRLARAATSILESAMGSDLAELEMAPSIQQVMLQLARFVKVNRQHMVLFADAVPIVTAFPLTNLTEKAAIEELMREVQAMLQEQLSTPGVLNSAYSFYVFDTILEGCARYFGRPRTDGNGGGSCVDAVLLSRLLPTLLQYTALLSQFIQPTQPACAYTHRFVRVLECISSILVYSGRNTAVLGFVSEDALLGFTRALGHFALSSVYDHATQRHHRLSWHVCWHAVLSLWCVVIALCGPYNAKAAGWLPPLQAALETTPRFASAIGVFPGPQGADRQALLVWEIEEVDVATRLAAALALQNAPLSLLLTSVQAGFLFLQQPRLQQCCVASLPTADASVSEGRRVAVAQAHALRNTLTFLLKQPYYALPRDGASAAAFVFAPELLASLTPKFASVAEEAGGASGTAASVAVNVPRSLVFSLDLLRHFIVRELQLLRRLTAGAATQERSPDLIRTSTGSAASRESSAGRSPSRGPLNDGETVTEIDEYYTADGAVEDAADQQAIHLETVQLALNAYAVTVDDFTSQASRAPGSLYTSAVLQTVRHTTERLLHTLHSLVREVRDLHRPLLRQIVQAKITQLQGVLGRL